MAKQAALSTRVRIRGGYDEWLVIRREGELCWISLGSLVISCSEKYLEPVVRGSRTADLPADRETLIRHLAKRENNRLKAKLQELRSQNATLWSRITEMQKQK